MSIVLEVSISVLLHLSVAVRELTVLAIAVWQARSLPQQLACSIQLLLRNSLATLHLCRTFYARCMSTLHLVD